MNLAIHSIEANLSPAPADTFLCDAHPDLKADFVLANPRFNVSMTPAHFCAATNAGPSARNHSVTEKHSELSAVKEVRRDP